VSSFCMVLVDTVEMRRSALKRLRSGTCWGLLHFAKDEPVYIASERLALPQKDSLVFLMVKGLVQRISSRGGLSRPARSHFRA
jgi:hypothetical protein